MNKTGSETKALLSSQLNLPTPLSFPHNMQASQQFQKTYKRLQTKFLDCVHGFVSSLHSWLSYLDLQKSQQQKHASLLASLTLTTPWQGTWTEIGIGVQLTHFKQEECCLQCQAQFSQCPGNGNLTFQKGLYFLSFSPTFPLTIQQ